MKTKTVQSGLIVALLATGGLALMASAANFPDPPKTEAMAQPGKANIVLAGGCFWGMEGVFEHVKGVTGTVVGYAGGKASTATYEQVEEGTTGHAESIQITYDPSKITYGEILKIYFSAAHDPTTVNRQHYDVGPQYRSAIFYADEQQKQLAEAYITQLNGAHAFKSNIVTQVVPLKGFFKAEDYHQRFLDRNPTQGYIVGVDIPLLNAFKAKYPEYYK